MHTCCQPPRKHLRLELLCHCKLGWYRFCTCCSQHCKTDLCFLCSLHSHNHIYQSFPSTPPQTRKRKTCGRCCLLRCRSFLSRQNTLRCRRHIGLMYCEVLNRLAMHMQEFECCTSKSDYCIRNCGNTNDNCMYSDTHESHGFQRRNRRGKKKYTVMTLMWQQGREQSSPCRRCHDR